MDDGPLVIPARAVAPGYSNAEMTLQFFLVCWGCGNELAHPEGKEYYAVLESPGGDRDSGLWLTI